MRRTCRQGGLVGEEEWLMRSGLVCEEDLRARRTVRSGELVGKECFVL